MSTDVFFLLGQYIDRSLRKSTARKEREFETLIVFTLIDPSHCTVQKTQQVPSKKTLPGRGFLHFSAASRKSLG